MSLGNELVKTENTPPDPHYATWFKLSIEWLKRVLNPFK